MTRSLIRFHTINKWLFFPVGPLHLIGHLPGKASKPNIETAKLLLHMATTDRFDFWGMHRSFMNLHDGFRLAITVLCMFVAGLNLLVARHARDNQRLLRATKVASFTASILLLALSIWLLILIPIFLFALSSA